LEDPDRGQNKISRRDFLQAALAGGVFAGLAHWTSALARNSGIRPAVTVDEAKASSRLEAGSPSLTAQGTAIHRAAHQILDDPRILDDPLAMRIIGAESESALRSNPARFNRSRSLRAFIVLRSRYAEDRLALAVQRGVRQYVILGAGLDSFPYRNPYSKSSLRVFEVDHPATQSWKRQRLIQTGIAIPDSLVFAPVDFEKQTLAEGLKKAGFRTDMPAFFSWLGVVVYLTSPSVMQTLEYVASLPPESEIVFDYSPPASRMSDSQRIGHEWLAERVAAIGEPWITYFDPSVLASELPRLGFKHLEDFGPEAANRRYFKGRADGLRITGAGHLMKAGC
jgi:methyltransferase (TIGR00027 family)